MALTENGRKALLNKLSGDIEQFIKDGLQDWRIAADSAVRDIKEPSDEKYAIFWFITLAGNMLWASTAFFAPETKILGVIFLKLGSALGSALASDSDRSQRQPDGVPCNDQAKMGEWGFVRGRLPIETSLWPPLASALLSQSSRPEPPFLTSQIGSTEP